MEFKFLESITPITFALNEGEITIAKYTSNMVGATVISNRIGYIHLTNQRFIYEAWTVTMLMKEKDKRVDFEFPLSMLTHYRHAYTVSIGQMVPMKSSFSVYLSDGKSCKFCLPKIADDLFAHFKQLVPSAQHLPDEKYLGAVVGVGTKVTDKFNSILGGRQSKHTMTTPSVSSLSPVVETINCPKCDTPNPNISKFCNSCGGKLQLECPNCNAPIENGKKFCGECGTPIKRNDICTSCSAETEEGQKFCNECGAEIAE